MLLLKGPATTSNLLLMVGKKLLAKNVNVKHFHCLAQSHIFLPAAVVPGVKSLNPEKIHLLGYHCHMVAQNSSFLKWTHTVYVNVNPCHQIHALSDVILGKTRMHLVFIIIGTPPGFLYTCFSFSSRYLSRGQYFSKWSIFSLVMCLIGCMLLDGFIGLVPSLSSYSIFSHCVLRTMTEENNTFSRV